MGETSRPALQRMPTLTRVQKSIEKVLQDLHSSSTTSELLLKYKFVRESVDKNLMAHDAAATMLEEIAEEAEREYQRQKNDQAKVCY